MVRIKLAAKRCPRTSRVPAWLWNRRQRRNVKRPFKIKLTLHEQKSVTIKRGGNVRKTIRLRRKTKYFNDRNARTFYFDNY